ncbi:phage major capsid protein [Rodentibacter pneumotropicus]|nr:phage major capsid protein [Rodentibacter pneumotropicus]THA06239.1 phage major capsid protein [Rodentibacter pneumotropicus]THA11875.1 phage major capsid protein [Rodentibacter pneumotropicus]
MFKKLLELRQQKAAKVAEMRAMLEKAEKENRSLDETETANFEAVKGEINQLTDEITRYETVADEERNLASNVNPVEQRSAKQFSNDELRHYIKTGELRNLTTTNGEDGGYSERLRRASAREISGYFPILKLVRLLVIGET